ncbi:MAG TPA: M50 family metallopeptidase [bacterium]|jgi:regulator of sigma E protease|nr:M50 family metallopeptidase [bacterium]
MTQVLPLLSSGGWLVATIVAFGAMIFFHELGHFLVAKRAGVTVHAFALGFGPKLWSVQRGDTTYALNLIPFGGYVKMAGEDFDEQAPEEGSFRHQPVGRRMAIVAAGPVMNLLLAAAILSVVAMSFGVPVGITNRVGMLVAICGQPSVPGVPGSEPGPCPAERAGLRSGDVIVAINGRPTDSGEVVVETIHKNPRQPLVLTVERGGQRVDVKVTPNLDPARKIGLIGFAPEVVRQRFNPITAVLVGIQRTGEIIAAVATAVAGLIREGSLIANLGGPVAAGRALVDAGRSGLETFLNVAATLSVIIGIFNLIPFPALDGGRLGFLIVEALRRRPVDPRREGYVHLVGFVLLILLLVFLTGQDIQR